MARLSELRLETRPYQWAEFRDIVLQPRLTGTYRPAAAPQALPGYVHTFSHGLTVAVQG